MTKSTKTSLFFTIFFLALSIVFTILVTTIDVTPSGVIGTNIGFSSLNLPIRAHLPYRDVPFVLSEVLVFVLYLPIFFFGFRAFFQFIQRKSLKKIDLILIYYYIIIVLTCLLYIFFDKYVINYRPLVLDGEISSSYPSSHTIVSLVFASTSIMVLSYYRTHAYFYKKYSTFVIIIEVLLALIALAVVVLRVLSGTHWATDIFAGILFSLTLVFAFRTAISTIPPRSLDS